MNPRMQEALQAFTTDSANLLDRMDEALLRLEQQPGDTASINTLFHAAHTIKGSAERFGVYGIVAFTHITENLLDKVKQGHIHADAKLTDLMCAVGQHIRTLLALADAGQEPGSACRARGEALIVRLAAMLVAESELQHESIDAH